MIPNIIESLNIFLKSHRLNKYVIEHRYVTINDNGESTVKLTFCDSIGFDRQNLQVPLTVQIVTIFSFLDSWIDINYTNIQLGSNFKSRYKNLPIKTDREIIFKETYRIFRKLRNTVIHNSANININNSEVDFDGIKLSIDTLYWLYSLSCELLSTNKNIYISETYHTGVLRYYYNKIVMDLKACGYSDDLSVPFLPISSDVKISVTIRYLVKNAEYKVVNEKLYLDRYDYGCDYYSADYDIVYCNKEYRIPEEALEKDDMIDLSKIDLWCK